MLRFLVLAFVALWVLVTIGRFTRRFRRPADPPWRTRVIPEPISRTERRRAIARGLIVTIVVLGTGAALFAWTGLPDVVIVLAVAPIAGLTSTLSKELLPPTPD